MNATIISLSLLNTVMGCTGDSEIHSKGTLGNMQILLKTLQQGYSFQVLEGRISSSLGFLNSSSMNHTFLLETLKCYPHGIALKNPIWFQFAPLFLRVYQSQFIGPHASSPVFLVLITVQSMLGHSPINAWDQRQCSVLLETVTAAK
jgi:hypothetical protein